MAAMVFDFYTLRNGVRVMLVPMEGVQSTAVGVYTGTGSRYESPQINGISHFLEHMAFKGTRRFPTHKDTSFLEGLGAIQNAWTDVDATCYYCKIPADHWEAGLELAKELALFPTIPNKDLEIERGVILEEIRRRDDRPDELSGEVLQEMMFPGNPLGMTILGNPEVIKAVSRGDFTAYHSSQYVSKNVLVVLAGKVDMKAVKPRIEEWFSDLEPKLPRNFEKPGPGQTDARVKIMYKELSNQAHIELAVPGLPLTDPRRFAATLLTVYLGRGLSSRLFLELREKRGLCYAVRASEERWVDTGVWSVYAGLNIEKLDDAVTAILSEMARVKETKLTKKELAEAKEKVRGPILFSAEDPLHQMDYYGRQALDRPNEILTYDVLIDRLMQIDAEEIRQIANDLFKAERLNLAVVGPVKGEEKLVKLLKV